jgi:hypothetical protein
MICTGRSGKPCANSAVAKLKASVPTEASTRFRICSIVLEIGMEADHEDKRVACEPFTTVADCRSVEEADVSFTYIEEELVD